MSVNKKQMKNALGRYIDKNYSETAGEHIYSSKNKVKINVILAENGKKSKKERLFMKNGKLKVGRIIALVCLCIVFSSVVVYAASPELRSFINMRFLKTDSVQRLTEVPEGYIGIYTAEDLDNVRNNLLGNYILMNDILLTEEDYAEGGIFEGGFVPIGRTNDGNREEFGDEFIGVFNGNGYVISGLVIEGDYDYAGLFGKVIRSYDGEINKGYGGIVKNLGIIDSVIKITKTPESYRHNIYAGGIGGHIDYIVGCYTENIDVIVDSLTSENYSAASSGYYKKNKALIGGLVGSAYFIDSCWSDANVSLINSDKDLDNIYISGLAGSAFSCITSYYFGNIDSGGYPDYGVTYCKQYTVPMILSRDILYEIVDRLDAAEGYVPPETSKEDYNDLSHCNNALKFLAFYCSEEYIAVDIPSQEFYTKELTEEVFYLLDPYIKQREYNELVRIISIAFPANDFNAFCRENNLKSGYYYCYDLRDEPECTFEGFDFTSIWDFTDTTPQLKLFTGGTFKKTPQQQYSDDNLYRLEWQKKVLKNRKNS